MMSGYEAMQARLAAQPEPARAQSIDSGFSEAFDASIRAVQTGFKHLSTQDIAHPPHQWFDAALARQIAIYLMVRQFGTPKRRIAEELQRSREAVNRALETVEHRLVSEEFAASYDEMAARAWAILKGNGDA